MMNTNSSNKVTWTKTWYKPRPINSNSYPETNTISVSSIANIPTSWYKVLKKGPDTTYPIMPWLLRTTSSSNEDNSKPILLSPTHHLLLKHDGDKLLHERNMNTGKINNRYKLIPINSNSYPKNTIAVAFIANIPTVWYKDQKKGPETTYPLYCSSHNDFFILILISPNRLKELLHKEIWT